MAVVAGAIQKLAVVRLGRGFVPLALLCLMGLGEMIGGGTSGWILALGAPVVACAMLAYGMRVVQRSLGRPDRAWMKMALVASVLPPALAIYVLAWRGLRTVAVWEGLASGLTGVLFVALGVWSLRAWWRMLELQALADTMVCNGFESSGAGE